MSVCVCVYIMCVSGVNNICQDFMKHYNKQTLVCVGSCVIQFALPETGPQTQTLRQ